LGNQQERLTVDTSSYLGGLVTGEGCFCFSVQNLRHGKLRITPIFAMFMSDRVTIDHAAEALAELGLPVYRQERPKATGRGQCGININGLRRVKKYCDTLLPFLTGQKREAATIVLEFIESRLSKPTHLPYSEEEIELVRRLRLVNGNTRGKKTPL
jgi:hypothetical protein